MDYGIAPDPGFRTDIYRFWIDKCHAAFKHQFRDRAAADDLFHLGELAAVVDALDLARIAALKNSNIITLVSEYLRNVSEVKFALGVFIFYLRKRGI